MPCGVVIPEARVSFVVGVPMADSRRRCHRREQNSSGKARDSGFLLLLQQWGSDDLDTVAHESPKREALEGHQHPADLVPGEGPPVDHQPRDLPGALRIPGDAADQMACVGDPPAEFPPLHMADRESVPDPVVASATKDFPSGAQS